MSESRKRIEANYCYNHDKTKQKDNMCMLHIKGAWKSLTFDVRDHLFTVSMLLLINDCHSCGNNETETQSWIWIWIWMKMSLLNALKVVKMTTSNAANDENFEQMTSRQFRFSVQLYYCILECRGNSLRLPIRLSCGRPWCFNVLDECFSIVFVMYQNIS